jgi:hypothetical protein
MWCLSHPSETRVETGTRNSFGLKSRVAFVSARLRPNMQRLCRFCSECQEWYMSQSVVIRGEIEKTNCYSPMSQFPLVITRLLPTLRSLCIVWNECNMLCLSHPAAKRGEIQRKTVPALRVNYRFLLPDFENSCSGCASWEGSESLRCNDRRDRNEKLFRLQE